MSHRDRYIAREYADKVNVGLGDYDNAVLISAQFGDNGDPKRFRTLPIVITREQAQSLVEQLAGFGVTGRPRTGEQCTKHSRLLKRITNLTALLRRIWLSTNMKENLADEVCKEIDIAEKTEACAECRGRKEHFYHCPSLRRANGAKK